MWWRAAPHNLRGAPTHVAAPRFRFYLTAANGEIIATSEAYELKATALNAIESVSDERTDHRDRGPDRHLAHRPSITVVAVPSSCTWDLLQSMALDTSIVRSQACVRAQARVQRRGAITTIH